MGLAYWVSKSSTWYQVWKPSWHDTSHRGIPTKELGLTRNYRCGIRALTVSSSKRTIFCHRCMEAKLGNCKGTAKRSQHRCRRRKAVPSLRRCRHNKIGFWWCWCPTLVRVGLEGHISKAWLQTRQVGSISLRTWLWLLRRILPGATRIWNWFNGTCCWWWSNLWLISGHKFRLLGFSLAWWDTVCMSNVTHANDTLSMKKVRVYWWGYVGKAL